MSRLSHLIATALIGCALPVLASSPGEDSGPAPRPEAGTGAGAALATGMTVTDASAALASKSLPITYEVFEVTVPHADLAQCPTALAQDGHFCRLGLASDHLTVFVFSEAGEQPLLAVRSWAADVILPALK